MIFPALFRFKTVAGSLQEAFFVMEISHSSAHRVAVESDFPSSHAAAHVELNSRLLSFSHSLDGVDRLVTLTFSIKNLTL